MNCGRLAAAAVFTVLLAACADDGATGSHGPSVTFSTVPATTTPNTADTSSVPADTTVPTAPPTTTPPTAPLAPGSIGLAPVASGLASPVDIAWRPGDTTTAYIVLQGGTIVPLRDGVVGTPVLDLGGSLASGGEQGLLGLAFHPTLPYAYIDYTNRSGDTVIAEYAVGDDGTFDPASVRVVLTIDQPYANHNGGNVAFGPDGYLYVGMGDGGSAYDPERRALDVGELLGKILRIDPRPSGDQPYGVPADNPFVGVAGARPEIWSVGVRNPWRFAFDTATGDLWIGDVGQNKWEEIDVARAADGGGRGVNFGWSAFEGTHVANRDQSTTGATPPVYEYPHGDDGCSVSGGTVYRGTAVPSLVGWYLFSDYCSGRVWALRLDLDGTAEVLTLTTASGGLSALRAGPDGEIYVLVYGSGDVQRIVPS